MPLRVPGVHACRSVLIYYYAEVTGSPKVSAGVGVGGVEGAEFHLTIQRAKAYFGAKEHRLFYEEGTAMRQERTGGAAALAFIASAIPGQTCADPHHPLTCLSPTGLWSRGT